MKLVRDKYIDIIPKEELDITPKDDASKLDLILDKLKEEALEFIESVQRDPEELADLMEVVVAWGEMNGHSFDTINHLRKEKSKKLGSFTNFVVLKDKPEPDKKSKAKK